MSLDPNKLTPSLLSVSIVNSRDADHRRLREQNRFLGVPQYYYHPQFTYATSNFTLWNPRGALEGKEPHFMQTYENKYPPPPPSSSTFT